MRQIDAQKLEKELQNMIDLGLGNIKVTLLDVLKEIQERETVFSEIVFCENCIHHSGTYCSRWVAMTADSDYCSDGRTE